MRHPFESSTITNSRRQSENKIAARNATIKATVVGGKSRNGNCNLTFESGLLPDQDTSKSFVPLTPQQVESRLGSTIEFQHTQPPTPQDDRSGVSIHRQMVSSSKAEARNLVDIELTKSNQGELSEEQLEILALQTQLAHSAKELADMVS